MSAKITLKREVPQHHGFGGAAGSLQVNAHNRRLMGFGATCQ